jgi:transcriptional regulator with XRE-family HTH domain
MILALCKPLAYVLCMQYTTQLLRRLRFIIGRNIHTMRLKHKMPLRKLARLSSINEVRLDHFELSKNEVRLDELLKIACVFGVGVQELMGYKTMASDKEREAEAQEWAEAFIGDVSE